MRARSFPEPSIEAMVEGLATCGLFTEAWNFIHTHPGIFERAPLLRNLHSLMIGKVDLAHIHQNIVAAWRSSQTQVELLSMSMIAIPLLETNRDLVEGMAAALPWVDRALKPRKS